jgi:hypothetical protein
MFTMNAPDGITVDWAKPVKDERKKMTERINLFWGTNVFIVIGLLF